MPLPATGSPAARRSLAALLAGFCLLLPISTVLLPHWPAIQLLSFGLLIPLAAWLALGQRPAIDRGLLLALLPLFAWGLLSALWALEPSRAVVLALRTLGTLLVALLLASCISRLPPDLARRALRWLLPGFAIALLLLLEERLSGLAIMETLAGVSYAGERQDDHLIRSALGLLLLSFPPGLLLWQRGKPWLAAALLLLMPATLLVFPSSTALLCALSAALLLALTLWRPALGRGLLLAGLLLGFLLMPLVAWLLGLLRLPDSDWLGVTARARAYVWDFTLQRILERPLFGWGLDASPAMPNFGAKPFFVYETKVIPLHPHSAGLQVWLELGLVGALLALLPLLRLWRDLRSLAAVATAFSVALAAAILTAGGLSFGLWQSRWLGLVLLSLLLLRLVRRGAEPD